MNKIINKIVIGAIYNVRSVSHDRHRVKNPIFQVKVLERATSQWYGEVDYKVETMAYNIGSGGPRIGQIMTIEANRLLTLVADNKGNAPHVLQRFKEGE